MNLSAAIDVQDYLVCVCVYGDSDHCIVVCAHLGNGTGRRTVTMAALLLLTSGPMRYEAVLHSCRISPVGEGVLTCDSVCTHGIFTVLPYWDIRPPAP